MKRRTECIGVPLIRKLNIFWGGFGLVGQHKTFEAGKENEIADIW